MTPNHAMQDAANRLHSSRLLLPGRPAAQESRRIPPVADLVLVRSMRLLLVLVALLGAVSLRCTLAQGTVVSDDRLPPDSIELKRNDPPATSTPWQLPKPGAPLYDAEKEAQIKKEPHDHSCIPGSSRVSMRN
jgi:hypothetical protein